MEDNKKWYIVAVGKERESYEGSGKMTFDDHVGRVEVAIPTIELARELKDFFEIKLGYDYWAILDGKDSWGDDPIEQSPKLLVWKEKKAQEHKEWLHARKARVKEINKMPKKFVLLDSGVSNHTLKVVAERTDAEFHDGTGNRIDCAIGLKYYYDDKEVQNVWRTDYISEDNKLLRAKFLRDNSNKFGVCTNLMADNLKRIDAEFEKLNREVKN